MVIKVVALVMAICLLCKLGWLVHLLTESDFSLKHETSSPMSRGVVFLGFVGNVFLLVWMLVMCCWRR